MRAGLPTPQRPWVPVNEPWRIGAKRIVSSIRIIIRIRVDGRWQNHRCLLVGAIYARRRRRRIGVGRRRSRLLIVTLLVAVTLLPRRRRIVLRRWLRLAVARL